jgi:hypothetical protein
VPSTALLRNRGPLLLPVSPRTHLQARGLAGDDLRPSSWLSHAELVVLSRTAPKAWTPCGVCSHRSAKPAWDNVARSVSDPAI